MKMTTTCMSTESQSLPLNNYLRADKGVPLPYKSYSKFYVVSSLNTMDWNSSTNLFNKSPHRGGGGGGGGVALITFSWL